MRGMIKTKFTTNYFLHSNFLIIYSPSISTPMSYHMLMMKGIIITDLRTYLYFNPFYNQYIFSSILHHNHSSLSCYHIIPFYCHSNVITHYVISSVIPSSSPPSSFIYAILSHCCHLNFNTHPSFFPIPPSQ